MRSVTKMNVEGEKEERKKRWIKAIEENNMRVVAVCVRNANLDRYKWKKVKPYKN